MFSLAEGATAIRSGMVRALAFSIEDARQQSGSGRSESVRGGLAAVWNGRAGQVIVVVRFVERGTVERYAWTEAIRSEAALAEAIKAGISCAENLGLEIDDPEFLALGPADRKDRLRRWNALRKPGKPRAGAKRQARPVAAQSRPEPRPEIAERGKAAPARGRTVLGRVAVVRKRTGEAGGSREAIGRILASY